MWCFEVVDSLDLLLVGLGLRVVLGLVDLVTKSILGGAGSEVGVSECAHEEMGRDVKTYRLPTPTLLSLATSLLASLEAPEVACWTDSAT